jgi:hypothetical protein
LSRERVLFRVPTPCKWSNHDTAPDLPKSK